MSEMGNKGFGMSKASGLKTMEKKATFYLGSVFPETDLGMVHVCTPAASQDSGLGQPGSFLASWDLSGTSFHQDPCVNHLCLLVTIASGHPSPLEVHTSGQLAQRACV